MIINRITITLEPWWERDGYVHLRAEVNNGMGERVQYTDIIDHNDLVPNFDMYMSRAGHYLKAVLKDHERSPE